MQVILSLFISSEDMKFKAAILVEQRKPLVVDDIEFNNTLDYGQVLVKIHYSGICGSQLGEIEGAKGPDKYLPHLLGHEGGGIVEEAGRGVTRVKRGDHVVMHWRKAAGIEAPTAKYQWGNKTVNSGWITTFNEYAVVSENRLTPIPKEVNLRIAALMGCAVLTGFGVVNNDAQVKIGQSVVIFGVGGVGLNIAQATSLVSAYPIVGIDLTNNKLELAKQFGLTHGINSNVEKDVLTEIKKIVGTQGADVVIDTTGNPRVIEQAYELTDSRGKTILVGVPKAGQNISIYSLPLHFDRILKGSHGGGAVPDEDIPCYLKLLSQGKMQLDELITHELSLTQVNDAVSLMNGRHVAGRIMISMDKAGGAYAR